MNKSLSTCTRYDTRLIDNETICHIDTYLVVVLYSLPFMSFRWCGDSASSRLREREGEGEGEGREGERGREGGRERERERERETRSSFVFIDH